IPIDELSLTTFDLSLAPLYFLENFFELCHRAILAVPAAPALPAEQPIRVVPQDLPPHLLGQRQGQEGCQVLLHARHSGIGPVGAPEDLVGDLRQAWEVGEEALRPAG